MKFEKFNKIPRLSRDMVITEKIDGTNAQIYIVKKEDIVVDMSGIYAGYVDLKLWENDEFMVFAGSRNRWLDLSSKGDNMGFAKWVKANAQELLKLGAGRHFGEWWGKGIQRGYEMEEKVFSLFNVGKWIDPDLCYAEGYEGKKLDNCPSCCRVVPILYEGMFDTQKVSEVLEKLRIAGSSAGNGYLMPEGIVIYHTASGKLFKKTIMNDEKPKGI